MAAGAFWLAEGSERFEAMRDAARKTAPTRFCSTLVVPQYVEYYEKVLGTPATGTKDWWPYRLGRARSVGVKSNAVPESRNQVYGFLRGLRPGAEQQLRTMSAAMI